MDLVPRLEAELSAPVVTHYGNQGYGVLVEVPFNGRIADVIACSPDEVVAVELKLRAWKTALRQALAYQVACHRSYVALPLAVARPLLAKSGVRDQFEAAGCGLLGVNHPFGDVRLLVEAGESPRRLPFLTDRLRSFVPAPAAAGDAREGEGAEDEGDGGSGDGEATVLG